MEAQVKNLKLFSRIFSALVMLALMAGPLVPANSVQAAGTIPLNTFGNSYTQDFNTLASSGTTNTIVPDGWDFTETGTNANTYYRAGTGSDNTGDTYSFGASGNAERAFGGLRSGSLVPLIGAQFTNNTDGIITSLDVAYTGEQWRLGQNTTGRAADRLDFQISTDATSLSTGTWTDYDSLDFSSPVVAGTVGALNGNVSPNRTPLSFTITGLSIPSGASFWIRWADSDLIPGADDGLSVDDFSLVPLGTAEVADPKINEFSASTTGTDVEYVEIFGTPNTNYSAYTVLEIEGDGSGSGVVDEVISGGTTDANGFYLVNLPANALENGTITLLLVKNFTGALNDDLDTNNDGAFDAMPWDMIVDAVAVNDGTAGDITYGAPSLAAYYDGLPYAPGGASRIPDGFDSEAATDWVRNDFDLAGIPGYPGTIVLGEAYNTPGAANQVYVPPPEMCGDPFTPIYDVQGSGPISPLVGMEVAIEGVVIGDFQNNASPDNGNLNGFHVQDSMGDGDASTSDGIFIYAPGGMDVTTGDAVRVRGDVSEYNGMTEITASQIWLCSAGNSVAPTPLSLPVTAVYDFEAYEGMLVAFPQALYISEYFNFDRYGEMVLTSERHLTPTAEFEPGPDAIQAAQEFLLDKITLDDGRTNQNPDPAIHPNGGTFDLGNLFRGGDTVQNVTGAMDYSFGLYRIQPTAPADYVPANPRPAAPEPVGGSLRVATINTLNFFITLDYPTGDPLDNKCGPLQNVECRGADADQPLEFTRQRDKLLAAIAGLDADIIGLNELENTTGVEPLGDPTNGLVAGLNAMLGAGTYAYIDTGVIGTDAIRVGLIYKPGKVLPLGAFQILDSSDDPRFLDTKNRPVLAQTFLELETGARFTVAVNHLKSKGSDCNDVGDPDLGDGQGNCNLTRKAAAQALVDWLATDPTGSGDPDFLIMGDLNSYALEDPIDAIKAGPDDMPWTGDDYTNLIAQYQGLYAYSYVFDGQLGYLDHALASSSLAGQVTGAADWHINADEPDLIDYDTSFKLPAQDALYEPNAYRSSDHDPVVVGLNLVNYPSERFVTGGGWFMSPAGAFKADPSLTGKATITFVAKYHKGEQAPKGNAQFQLKAGNLKFHSTSYDWLVVSGSQAIFKGVGSINGQGTYTFMIWANDNDPDTVHIKIWYVDQYGVEVIVYDNGFNQPLGGGSIMFHK
jgi:hypothetical protein